MKTTVSVSNDLYNDNRVLKICESLHSYGWEVTVVCKNATKKRQNNNTDFTDIHPFLKTKRLKFLFKKNVWYYAELNLRLFFSLLFTKSDILWANDLDTLPANYLVSILKHKPLVFDSHEMFCYVAELKPDSIQQKVWLKVEGWIVPKLKYIVTVCDPIREYFAKKYGVNSLVIRNIPPKSAYSQEQTDIYKNEKYIIWQGSVNIDRGLEELVEAMQYVNCKLLICGQGDIFCNIQLLIKEKDLQDKVKLIGRLPYDNMMSLTQNAVLGISIDKPTNGNYAISLPNKIFEYINACLPVLYSPLSEIKKIEDQFHCGLELKSYDISELSSQINEIISDDNLLKRLADNCLKAQSILNWHNEEMILHDLAKKIESEEFASA
ncbi:MAG: glycosyltransferase [Bacteroidales bacterium]|nr:glycosyltransferase [Bacteroidales bacterium]